ncbi:MAG TPA: polysaccharide deacetylase family protein [Solirubrobacteraceae bacterium]|nr:polysaccharide deacetylase family protein [Solirubrobacteraceae bacterium]
MNEQPTPRRTVSQAEHHRRRRRAALAGLCVGALLLAIVVATSAGSGGTWNPTALRDGAITELPRLRLEEQAQRASIALARQKRARTQENAAISRTLRESPYVRVAGDQTRSVALTFDDGPSPYTQRILDALRREKAKGTFFTLGNQLAEFPLPLQRAVAEGHAIGDHTWNHADLTRLAPADVKSEITDHAAGLQKAGIPRPRLFRPPYGAYNDETLRIARRTGMLTVLWTIDSNDYKAADPKAMADAVLAEARPGAIILLHDGGGDRTVTSRALPLIVRGLRERKFKMVTVPQLLITNPAPVTQDAVTRTPVA